MPEALFSAHGRICLVTGAGSGIGQATAELLAEAGATVAVNDIGEASARATCERLGMAYDAALIGDVTDPEQAQRVVAAVIGQHGRLDILVNNAAAPVELAGFLDVPPGEWTRHMSSLYATLACTHAALPGMLERGFGRIVNVTSIAGSYGVDKMVLYGAGKGGVHGFTAGLAKEIAGRGVTINCVAPGTVDTPRQRQRAEDERARRMARVPAGRFAEPREVAAAIAYLASEEAGYVTGEILFIDGGRP
jgi:NAD(P)-dependent dehydrogenase (short-subunit alcohol dehydrogenase family)